MGTVEEKDFSFIKKELAIRASKVTPFILRLDNLTIYPSWNKPRIVIIIFCLVIKLIDFNFNNNNDNDNNDSKKTIIYFDFMSLS